MCKIVVKVTEKEQQGMRLEQLRNNLKLNQKTFAKALGISQGYLSQILLGKKSISYRILNSITNGFKMVNVEWLLSGHEPMFKTEQHSNTPKASVANEVNSDSTSTVLAVNIVTIRSRWKRDQEEFGALLGGATRHQVSNWERGRTEPDYDVLSRLEALTGIPQKRIRTQELLRSEIATQPKPMAIPLPKPGPTLEDIYAVQQEILQRVAAIEDILRVLRDRNMNDTL